MQLPHELHNIHNMQTNNVNSSVSLNALHADGIDKLETSIKTIIVAEEPGTDSFFPIRTLATLVLYTKIRNYFPVPDSLIPILQF